MIQNQIMNNGYYFWEGGERNYYDFQGEDCTDLPKRPFTLFSITCYSRPPVNLLFVHEPIATPRQKCMGSYPTFDS
jgi:hypothetical protein